MEAEHGSLQSRVQHVHAVDGVVVGVGLREVRAQFGQRLHIGVSAVRQHVRPVSDMGFQRVHGAFLGDDAAPAHGQERPARIIHAGRHAYLLLRRAAIPQCLGSLVGFAGHDEHRGLRMVALEALTEVRLVQLHARPGLGTQDGSVSADALDDPLAHEERGLQAYSATPGALAQAQAIHEAFEKTHPYARLELAHAHHPVRANAERPVAVHALPTLGAVTSTPFADDADAAAAHASIHALRIARRRVQREPLVQRIAQRLDGEIALLRRQFAQFLPDPIGYTRHLARSHTTTVATQ